MPIRTGSGPLENPVQFISAPNLLWHRGACLTGRTIAPPVPRICEANIQPHWQFILCEGSSSFSDEDLPEWIHACGLDNYGGQWRDLRGCNIFNVYVALNEDGVYWRTNGLNLWIYWSPTALSFSYLINQSSHQPLTCRRYFSQIVHDDFLNLLTKDPDDTPMSPPYSQSKPVTQSSSLQLQNTPSIPPHSLIAFGIFLRLPGYSEVLLKERKKAQYLLRLVLGVTDDGNGGRGSCFLWLSSSNISAIFFILHLLFIPFGSASSSDNISILYSFFLFAGLILNSSVAGSLPSLPFQVLKRLLDSSPLTTDDGMLLRRMCVDIGVLHLILACLSILGHHAPRQHIPGLYQEVGQLIGYNEQWSLSHFSCHFLFS